jgi:hypothetical protein
MSASTYALVYMVFPSERARERAQGVVEPTAADRGAQIRAVVRSSRVCPVTTAGFAKENISCMVTSFDIGVGPSSILPRAANGAPAIF